MDQNCTELSPLESETMALSTVPQPVLLACSENLVVLFNQRTFTEGEVSL